MRAEGEDGIEFFLKAFGEYIIKFGIHKYNQRNLKIGLPWLNLFSIMSVVLFILFIALITLFLFTN